MDIPRMRNSLRSIVSLDYRRLVETDKQAIAKEVENQKPEERLKILQRYHRRILDKYQGQVQLIVISGAHHGQTGDEALAFATDLDNQLYAIDKAYGFL